MKLVQGRLLLTVAAVMLVVAGCGSSTEGEAEPVGSAGVTTGAGSTSTTEGSIPENAPVGFDPCTDISQDVLDSEGLRNRSNTDSEGSNGLEWRGCGWIQTDGYAPSIRVTNITVDMVRENKGRVVRDEYTIDEREAIASNTDDESDPRSVCTVHVAMNGGSLEFFLDNPSSNKKTGHLDTCQLARTLAEKVVPLIPPNS
ncbi:DUF3558 domain-containing protein [Nocardia sp. NPDC059180]|uniref:DUF3558 domain-containing protein n=1 Tax=Nocardia sp. NPDC059180 TaxID=3346761 RepID=UPI0036B2D5B6